MNCKRLCSVFQWGIFTSKYKTRHLALLRFLDGKRKKKKKNPQTLMIIHTSSKELILIFLRLIVLHWEVMCGEWSHVFGCKEAVWYLEASFHLLPWIRHFPEWLERKGKLIRSLSVLVRCKILSLYNMDY